MTARPVGVRLATELLADLHGLVQGAYLMPPFARYDLAAEILDAVRARPAQLWPQLRAKKKTGLRARARYFIRHSVETGRPWHRMILSECPVSFSECV